MKGCARVVPSGRRGAIRQRLHDAPGLRIVVDDRAATRRITISAHIQCDFLARDAIQKCEAVAVCAIEIALKEHLPDTWHRLRVDRRSHHQRSNYCREAEKESNRGKPFNAKTQRSNEAKGTFQRFWLATGNWRPTTFRLKPGH